MKKMTFAEKRRIFTISNKRRGELAIRQLSAKARQYYNDNYITVAEYLNEELEPVYAIDECDGATMGMTLNELDTLFSTRQDDWEAEMTEKLYKIEEMEAEVGLIFG